MTDTGLWWLALGLGLVVLLVAVALLQLFLREVQRIELHAREVWQAGKGVAANTATTWQLQQTAAHTDALAQEAERHAVLLRGNRTAPGGRESRRDRS